MSFLFCCCLPDEHLYEITSEPEFQTYVDKSVLEYRFMVGKNIHRFVLSHVMKGKKMIVFDGRSQTMPKYKDVDLCLDVRCNIVYGVYQPASKEPGEV